MRAGRARPLAVSHEGRKLHVGQCLCLSRKGARGTTRWRALLEHHTSMWKALASHSMRV